MEDKNQVLKVSKPQLDSFPRNRLLSWKYVFHWKFTISWRPS